MAPRDYFLVTVLTVCGFMITGSVQGGSDGSFDIQQINRNALTKDASNGDCISRNCGHVTTKLALTDCVSQNCKRVKRWIDTTHYSEGRRSVLDSLERCIRFSCHGKGGMSLKECAFACSEKRKRSDETVNEIEKKWVDPLNYGMDDKRSAEKRPCRNCVDPEERSTVPEKPQTAFVCDQLCAGQVTRPLPPYICRIRCQEALDAALLEEF